MPATRLSQKNEDLRKLRSTIRHYADDQDRYLQDVSKESQICKASFYAKLKAPDMFRVDDLRRIRRTLKIPIEEYLEAIKPLLL